MVLETNAKTIVLLGAHQTDLPLYYSKGTQDQCGQHHAIQYGQGILGAGVHGCSSPLSRRDSNFLASILG